MKRSGRALPDGILVLTTTFPRHCGDPTGRFIYELLEVLPFRFRLVVPDDAALGDLRLPRAERHTFHNLGLFYGAGAPANMRARPWRILPYTWTLALMVWTALRQARRCRVVWSHWAVPSGLVGAFCRIVLRRPHVLLLHSGDVWFLERSRWRRLLARFIAKHTDALLAVSEDLAARFEQAAGRRPQVLPCGVFAAGHSRRGGRPVVGMLSRMVASKGMGGLIDRAGRIDGRLYIAGDGPEAVRVREASTRDPGLVYCGPLVGEDKRRFLAGVDVFAAPYERSPSGQPEGLPVAILEALASGCAVVAFESSGPHELLRDGDAAVVVPDGDFEAFVTEVNRLLADDGARHRMAEAARERVRPYLMENVATAWTRLLSGLMANSRSGQHLPPK